MSKKNKGEVMKKQKMAINKIQKKIIAIAIPVIVVLVGFSMIGSGYSTVYGESGVAFNPIKYLSKNGVAWSFVVFLIGAFEFFWWKDRDKENE